MLAVLLAALESDADRQKFIEIYEKYHVQMERTAMRILKEQSDVEDAVQNAFMQMIRHFEKIFEIPCEELPFWIISIVKNEARAILRKNRRTVSLEDWDRLTEDINDIAMLFLLRQYEICVFHFCLFCLFACTMGNTEVRKSGFIIGHTRYTFYSLQFCVVIRSFNNRF